MIDRCEYSVYDDDSNGDEPNWRCNNPASVFYVQMVVVNARGSLGYETHAVCGNHQTMIETCFPGVKVTELEYTVHAVMQS